MKGIALLVVMIILGGMMEYKIPYPQPDKDDNLLTKEIITGTVGLNISQDLMYGIPPFYRYDFPTDIRDVGKIDIYSLSEKTVWNETLDKIKERLYLPIYAQASDPKLRLLTHTPRISTTPVYIKTIQMNRPEPSLGHYIELPSELGTSWEYNSGGIGWRSYYWDGKEEAIAYALPFNSTGDNIFNKRDKIAIIKIHPDGYVTGYDVYSFKDLVGMEASSETVVGENVPIFVKTCSVSVLSNYEDMVVLLTIISEITSEDYVGAKSTEKIQYIYHYLKNGKIIKSVEQDISINGGAGMGIVYPYQTYQYHPYASYHNGKTHIFIFNKRKMMFHTVSVEAGYERFVFNPVLGTIAMYNDNKSAVYRINQNREKLEKVFVKNVGRKGLNKSEQRYFHLWAGNLEYDYLIDDIDSEFLEGTGGRGHYPLTYGETEADMKIKYTNDKSYGSSAFRLMGLGSTDDGDIGTWRGVSTDRKNFYWLQGTSSQVIRLYRKHRKLAIGLLSGSDELDIYSY